MSSWQPNQIHPTAIVSPEAEIGEGVIIGPYVVIDGPVQLGPECIIKPFVHLVGPLKMGRGNSVFSSAVIGERPQHLKFGDEPTGVEIGDFNIIRENVTIHRGTTQSWVTRIGNKNFFMAGSHIAHDCQIGSNCIFANGVLLAGHCIVQDNVFLSGNAAIHQFVRIGRLAMLSGLSSTTKDIPPFFIQQGRDNIVGVNVIGMRRAGMPAEQINGVRAAFRILLREGLTLPLALARIEATLGEVEAVRELLTFLKDCNKGVNPMRSRGDNLAA